MTSSLNWDYPEPHTVALKVLPEHIDVMRHTNNVVYQQWMEAAAWSHSQANGLGPADYEACGHGMVVRRHELDYLAASHLGEDLVIGTWLLSVDRLSTHRVYQIIRLDDGQTIFRGATHLVCIEIASGRLKRMPALFYETYSRLVTSPANADSTTKTTEETA